MNFSKSILLFLFSSFSCNANLEKIALSKLANSLINEEYDLLERIDQINHLPKFLIDPLRKELALQSCKLFSPKLCRELIGHKAEICCVALSANGKYALTASNDKSVGFWDVQDSYVGEKRKLPSEAIALALSPDGHFAFISYENKSELWDLTTKNPIKGWPVEANSKIEAAALSADNKYLLAGGYRRYQARLHDITKYPFESFILGGHADSISVVAFNEDGKFAATGVSYGHLKILSLADDRIRNIHEHKGMLGIHSIALSSDAKYALTGSYDHIRFWDLTKEPNECQYLKGHVCLARIIAISFASNDKYAFTATSMYNDHTIRMWDLSQEPPTCIKVIELENYGPTVFSPDGKYALVGSADGIARLWKLDIFLIINDLSIDELILVIKLQQLKLEGKSYNDLLDIAQLRQILENSKHIKHIEDYFAISL